MKKDSSSKKLIDSIDIEATILKIMREQGWPKLISISHQKLVEKAAQEPQFILSACDYLKIEPVTKAETKISKIKEYLKSVQVILDHNQESVRNGLTEEAQKNIFLMNFVSNINLIENNDFDVPVFERYDRKILNSYNLKGFDLLMEIWNNGVIGPKYCNGLKLELRFKIEGSSQYHNTASQWSFPFRLFKTMERNGRGIIIHPCIIKRDLAIMNLKEFYRLKEVIEKIANDLDIKFE